MKPSKLITVAQAADLLGWSPKRFRRHVRRHEEETGRVVLVRVGAGSARATYRVNLATLRKEMPELFDSRDEVERTSRALLSKVMQTFGPKLEHIADRMDEMEPKLARLADATARVARGGR